MNLDTRSSNFGTIGDSNLLQTDKYNGDKTLEDHEVDFDTDDDSTIVESAEQLTACKFVTRWSVLNQKMATPEDLRV